MLPKVFIASSSEGLIVANAVRGLLLFELVDKAEVRPWTREFELSAAYIESLEKALWEMDFAVVVLTPDDVITSRDAENLAPRDNVVFELGLFIGRLGRERCFIVHEETPDLKLPTDLLGVKAATFKRPSNKNDLKAALDAPCFLMSERIASLGNRYKLGAAALADQMAILSFVSQIEGEWWERIQTSSGIELSFFTIRSANDRTELSMRGDHYDGQGNWVGSWSSDEIIIRQAQRKLFYIWEGEKPPTREGDKVQVQGFGTMDFDHAVGCIEKGRGGFIDVNPNAMSTGRYKSIRLKRVTNKDHVDTMTKRSDADKRIRVTQVLADW
jgi:hypothetical protein